MYTFETDGVDILVYNKIYHKKLHTEKERTAFKEELETRNTDLTETLSRLAKAETDLETEEDKVEALITEHPELDPGNTVEDEAPQPPTP